MTRAAVLCTGVRNLALALLLAATHFPAPETDTAILSFAVFMLSIPAGTALLWGQAAARRASAPRSG